MSDRLTLAARAGRLGIWEWRIASETSVWDEQMFRLFGLDRACGEPTNERWIASIHADDRSATVASLQESARGRGAGEVEFRVLHRDGDIRHLHSIFVSADGPDGPALVGITADVTDLRRLETSLRASEQRMRGIVNNANQAILTIDSGGRITTWNRQAEAVFGWSAAEALGARVDRLLVPPRLHGQHLEPLKNLQGDSSRDLRFESVGLRKSGEEFASEVFVSAVDGVDGAELIALVTDISRHKAQLELFENAFRYAAVGMCLVAIDGTFLKLNEAMCRILGYSESELLARDIWEISSPGEANAARPLIARLLKGEIDSYRTERRYIRADGATVLAEVTVSLVRHPDGAPKHFVTQVQDQTARRAMEQALKDSEARYRLMAENVTDVIATTDLMGYTTFVSPSCFRVTGYSPEQLVGRRSSETTHPDDVEGVKRVFKALLAGAPPERIRWRGRHARENRWIWFESGPSLLRDDVTGAPIGFMDIIRDVTEQVAQEEALADARRQAEAAAVAKAQFLANMSHEIRTPLTAVVGFTGLLGEVADLPPAARDYADRIAAASRGLLAIVNDILDFSKLEAGQFEIRPAPADAVEICRETLQMFAPQAEQKGLELAFEAPHRAPPLIFIDPDRLRQILVNLVGNAIKFTLAGFVRVRVSYEVRRQRLRVEVRDSGPGIGPSQRRKLFQRFSQVDASASRQHGGTGLGLAICRGLAEAMGGQVGVTSVPGRGSTFRVSIPAPKVDAIETRLSDENLHSIEGVKVLIVDDNPTNRELGRTLLEAFGATVSEARDGPSALELAAHAAVDVILMDLRMPGMDGRQARTAIRRRKGPNQHVPILAFTADAELDGPADRPPPGFDGLVRKPITPRALCRAIGQAMHRGSRAGDSTRYEAFSGVAP